MPTDFPRCETCRHWGTNGVDHYDGAWKSCGAFDAGDFGEPENPQAIACAVGFSPSGQEQWGELRTRSDFGCIAHEPKEG